MRETADKEIEQKNPICEWLLAANSCSPQDLFPRCIKSLHKLYSFITPSNVKVSDPLEASPATTAETETLAHLKRFIRGLD